MLAIRTTSSLKIERRLYIFFVQSAAQEKSRFSPKDAQKLI
jgi:hypothetical protein